jgi:nicotinamide riboside kinase
LIELQQAPAMQRPGLCIALLGAESTGKTRLALDIETALNALRVQGFSVAVVPEVLREWCELQGRVPTKEEQRWVAREQERRVQEAAASHDLVIADTTSLMTAVYSELVYADASLYDYAQSQLARYNLHWVTGLDIDWVADGIQRDGPHVREQVDARVRHHLRLWECPHATVWGQGAQRLQSALQSLTPLLQKELGVDVRPLLADQDREQGAGWRWVCERCSDGACEHQLFSRLTG